MNHTEHKTSPEDQAPEQDRHEPFSFTPAADEELLLQELSELPIKSEGEKEIPPAIAEFLKKLEALSDATAKLQYALEFMQEAISQSGNPQFKNFWESRRYCLELFKENISPLLRTQYWTKYRELTGEARRLKELLDEQSAFASEQIDVAITALEQEIQNAEQSIARQPEVVFEMVSKTITSHFAEYETRQRELNLFNSLASQINALRKELIKTEMRIRQKNKFFKRLSVLGDSVFPRRKELIKDNSDQFIRDVEGFVVNCLQDETVGKALFFYREEIKALQSIAKMLTLNTQAFTSTRNRLSECWDKIKVLDKERKKEQAQMRQTFKQNSEEIQKRIQEFNTQFETGELSLSDASKRLDEISAQMRRIELGRQEVAELKEAMALARKPLQEKLKAKENERLQEEAAREQRHREKLEAIRGSIEILFSSASQWDAERLANERDTLQQEINDLRATKSEKMELEKLLKPVRDLITEKKEKALLTLPENDQEALRQMYEVLRQRKERRKEIKEQLEQLRKGGKTSGLDFEQAIIRSEMINAERERLERANQSIEEIESQITSLEERI